MRDFNPVVFGRTEGARHSLSYLYPLARAQVRLDISGNGLDETDGAALIAALQRNRTLEALAAPRNGLGPAWAASVRLLPGDYEGTTNRMNRSSSILQTRIMKFHKYKCVCVF